MVIVKKPLRPKVVLKPVAVKSRLGTKVIIYIATVLVLAISIAIASLVDTGTGLGNISINSITKSTPKPSPSALGTCFITSLAGYDPIIKTNYESCENSQNLQKSPFMNRPSLIFCPQIDGNYISGCGCDDGHYNLPLVNNLIADRNSNIDALNNGIWTDEEQTLFSHYNNLRDANCGCNITQSDPREETSRCSGISSYVSPNSNINYCTSLNGPASNFVGSWELKQATSKLWSKMMKLDSPLPCQILPPGCIVTRAAEGNPDNTGSMHATGNALDICCGDTPDLKVSDTCTGIVQDLFTQISGAAVGTGISILRECTNRERSEKYDGSKCGNTTGCTKGLIHLFIDASSTPKIITNCDYKHTQPL